MHQSLSITSTSKCYKYNIFYPTPTLDFAADNFLPKKTLTSNFSSPEGFRDESGLYSGSSSFESEVPMNTISDSLSSSKIDSFLFSDQSFPFPNLSSTDHDSDNTPLALIVETPNISIEENTLSTNIGEQRFTFINCFEFGAYQFVYVLSVRIILFILFEPIDHNQVAVSNTLLTNEHSIPLPITPASSVLSEQNTQTDMMGNDQSVELSPEILLQNLRLKNNERIIIGHLNINSIPNKIGLLEDLVHNRVDILLVSETKINGSFPTDQIRIMGFEIPFRLDRTARGGGLLLYIRKDIPARRKSLVVSGIECITVEVTMSKKSGLYVEYITLTKSILHHF